jgi:hypothetical protein
MLGKATVVPRALDRRIVQRFWARPNVAVATARPKVPQITTGRRPHFSGSKWVVRKGDVITEWIKLPEILAHSYMLMSWKKANVDSYLRDENTFVLAEISTYHKATVEADLG